ncbi:MAG: hypothetical protein KGK07_16295, partial [Chloroflexota bacterium]|nr:hypothetical protein [Chloroflexota bacterium]
RRSSHSASGRSAPLDPLLVTHPFHPLSGQRVRVLFEQRRPHHSIGRLYVCDGGTLGQLTLPEGFTDRGPEAAPQPLTVEVLAELAAVVAAMGSGLDSEGRR